MRSAGGAAAPVGEQPRTHGTCAACAQVAEASDAVAMTQDGVAGNFVNAHGHVHDMVGHSCLPIPCCLIWLHFNLACLHPHHLTLLPFPFCVQVTLRRFS